MATLQRPKSLGGERNQTKKKKIPGNQFIDEKMKWHVNIKGCLISFMIRKIKLKWYWHATLTYQIFPPPHGTNQSSFTCSDDKVV